MTYRPADIAQLLERMDKREKLDLIEQEIAKRMGAQPRRREEDSSPRLARSTMSPAEKSRYIREHGKVSYDALPWSNEP